MEDKEIKYKELDPYEGINLTERRALIKDKNGDIIFDEIVEFPDFYSDTAVNIVSNKYLCNEAKHKETSIKQMIDRVSNAIANDGLKDGYFGNDFDDNDGYYEFLYKLKYYQMNQYFTFNSPVYFNCGLSDKPQNSACFILDIDDDMESIYESIKLESFIFKHGSGSGMNMSRLRSNKEKVRGGGFASGPTSFLKSADTSAGVIKSGGTLRRSAKLVCLNIDHPDILDFVYCKEREEKKLRILKKAGLEPLPGYELSDEVFFQNTNISLTISDEFMRTVENDGEWWTRYILNGEKFEKFNSRELLKQISELIWRTGDPGFQFSDTMNRWNTCKNTGDILSTNPCVVGDTLIATTCGRAIPIKDLAESGDDILVYTVDTRTNEIKICKGIHPRKTGFSMPIYKITLDDGTILRTTHNHKLILRNGKTIEVKDLNIGDSLMPFNMRKQKNGDYNSYLFGKTFKEHKLLAEYKYGRRISYKNSEIVHHKDGIHENNTLDNIVVKNNSDHSKDHISDNNPMKVWWPQATDQEKIRYKNNMSKAVSGENNARYMGISNEEIKQHAIKLTEKLGRAFTTYDWRQYAKENKLPEFRVMSKWRKIHLNGSIIGLSKWAALKCNKIVLDCNQRIMHIYYNMLDQGYNPEIINGDVYIHKECEECGKDFIRHFHRRELCFCKSCSSRKANIGKIIPQKQKDKIKKTAKIIWNTEKGKKSRRESAIISTKNKALSCGNMLLFLGKYIDESNWDYNKDILKENGIKKFIQKKIIYKYWDNWNDFIEDCKSYNHKVTNIEFDGYEDVYNLTADEYHIYAIVTNNTDNGMTGIMSSNCGEFAWHNNSSCNLAAINLMKFFTIDNEGNVLFDFLTYQDIIRTVITAQDILVSHSSYPSRKITLNTHNYRPLGLGYSNLGSLLMWLGLPYDSEESRNIASLLTAILTGTAYKTSNEIANKLGSFSKFEENRDSFYRVLKQHKESMHKLLGHSTSMLSKNMSLIDDLSGYVRTIYDDFGYMIDNEVEFRNAQVTLLAPTGTTSFMMDCQTKGIEPEFSLISYKTLSGNDGATIKIINQIVKDALENLGYNKSEVEDLCYELHSMEHFENSEILKEEHLPIFDTANTPKGGKRYIDYSGHVKMVAAVQPFISGAISKTVNMPKSVTVEEIYNLIIESWKLGLKGITMYRDKSKEEQPLNSFEKSKDNKCTLEIPCKRKLPDTRKGEVHKFSIGSTEGYLMTGEFDNGELGETFLTVAKQGSTLSGLLDMLAIMISISLQHGVPLKSIVSKLMFSRFDPSGITSNSDIRFATSICDYLGRYLGNRYLSEKDKEDLGLKHDKKSEFDEFEEITVINSITDNDGAPVCDCCGGMMQRVGTCFNCNNCGANSGACG
jgi:ribonucleotide reductase alpha subunit